MRTIITCCSILVIAACSDQPQTGGTPGDSDVTSGDLGPDGGLSVCEGLGSVAEVDRLDLFSAPHSVFWIDHLVEHDDERLALIRRYTDDPADGDEKDTFDIVMHRSDGTTRHWALDTTPHSRNVNSQGRAVFFDGTWHVLPYWTGRLHTYDPVADNWEKSTPIGGLPRVTPTTRLEDGELVVVAPEFHFVGGPGYEAELNVYRFAPGDLPKPNAKPEKTLVFDDWPDEFSPEFVKAVPNQPLLVWLQYGDAGGIRMLSLDDERGRPDLVLENGPDRVIARLGNFPHAGLFAFSYNKESPTDYEDLPLFKYEGDRTWTERNVRLPGLTLYDYQPLLSEIGGELVVLYYSDHVEARSPSNAGYRAPPANATWMAVRPFGADPTPVQIATDLDWPVIPPIEAGPGLFTGRFWYEEEGLGDTLGTVHAELMLLDCQP